MGEKHDIGNLHHFLAGGAAQERCGLSYAPGAWPEFEQWKTVARAKVLELLHYFPWGERLEPATLSSSDSAGLHVEEVEFSTARGVRVRGLLSMPSARRGRLPGVIALHDHGGFYFYGKEKIVECGTKSGILAAFKDRAYGGRSWASDLARRGFVVLVIDAFYFGTRRLDVGTISDLVAARIPYRPQGLQLGSDEYIREYNLFCEAFEALVVKHILTAGATWPGILFYDDRRSVDYLVSRDEVDPERIGCCGLSIGGYRSLNLAALDPRIQCAVVTGWLPTYNSLLQDRLRDHTYMVYVPGIARFLDLPDVAALTAPHPLLVQQCVKDPLYRLDGMRASCRRLSSIYASIGRSQRFASTFYDTYHEFNPTMQEEAFRWIDRWLK
jgi:dienelactone hydrolase